MNSEEYIIKALVKTISADKHKEQTKKRVKVNKLK